MKTFGNHLKLEAYGNAKSKMLPDLYAAVAETRKLGDYSQEGVANSRIAEVISAHTKMKIVFYVSEEIGLNAMVKFPEIDGNHPFFKQRGFDNWLGSDLGINLVKKGPVEGTVDVMNYRVSGVFSEIPCPIIVGLALMKSNFSNEEVAEIIAHEAGHHFTYFQYLGSIVSDSFMISAAAKIAVGSADPQVKEKVLIQVVEQLGIEPLNYGELLGTPNATRKETIEKVLISNSLLKAKSQSSTNYYDYRVLEQLADSFVAYHGGGRALASALVKISKASFSVSTRSTPVYIILELLKTVFVLSQLCGAPISTLIWLITMIPGEKIYDDPEQRVKTLKQQMIQTLRTEKDDDLKKQLVSEIAAIDASLKELNDRRKYYDIVFDAITPIGRKRRSQELEQNAIKDLIFNDFQAKALEMRN